MYGKSNRPIYANKLIHAVFKNAIIKKNVRYVENVYRARSYFELYCTDVKTDRVIFDIGKKKGLFVMKIVEKIVMSFFSRGTANSHCTTVFNNLLRFVV